MLNVLFYSFCVVLAFTSVSSAATAASHGSDCASCHTLSEKEATVLLKKTGGTVASVKQAPVKGFFELLVERNGQKGIIFLDYSKKHLIQGMVFNLEKLEPVSAHKLDFPQPKQQTSLDVTTIPVKNAIIMGNPKGAKKLYVFTDPDCPYCKKGHVELKKLATLAPDVAIYIMLYPLPMHPGAYDKARIVVETRDLAILDKAFEDKEVPKPAKEDSKAAIDEIITFANASGISGTPTMVMPDGKIEVGMRDAETLKRMLNVQ
jgi:thiol:disulfide interchange protein DsbC